MPNKIRVQTYSPLLGVDFMEAVDVQLSFGW